MSDTSSINFSKYKRTKIAELAAKIEPLIKDEVAPIRNNVNSIIPAKFSIHNATEEEKEEIRKNNP